MSMFDLVRRIKRDILRDRVIANGQALSRLYADRAGIDALIWPDDAAHLDAQIDRHKRRADTLLTKFKEA